MATSRRNGSGNIDVSKDRHNSDLISLDCQYVVLT